MSVKAGGVVSGKWVGQAVRLIWLGYFESRQGSWR
jgi:hypothetical protein